MTDQSAHVDFYGQTLITIQHDGIPYVALRPIVDSMGLDWKSQHAKLVSDYRFSCGDITTTGSDGKQYQMLCIPLRKLNAWLFTINANKVRSDLRETLIHYQEECAAVLYTYWHSGIVINPRLTSKQLPLWEQTPELHDATTTITVSDAWKLLMITQPAGMWPSRNVLLSMVKRGTLSGGKNAQGIWVIRLDAFNDFVRRLKLQM